MKTLSLSLAVVALAPVLRAADTTPPTLTITHTWIEKQGTRSNFKMLLDPKDETGLAEQIGPGLPGVIYFRSALNNPTVNLNGAAWNMMPWTRGQPFSLGFTCTACVIEIQARDAAGNASPVQRRVFQSPFPYSAAPDTGLKLKLSPALSFSGTALDCRGLFSGKFDDSGLGDDILQVDRAIGVVTVRRQEIAGWVADTVVTVAANTIEDSAVADYDGDGRMDLALIVNGALRLYHNDGDGGSSVLGFTEVTLNSGALAGMSLTTATNVVFGDISGEGKPELIVAGTDGGGAARVGWLDHHATNRFLSGNHAVAPTGSSSGRVAPGDVTGDGFNDVVMVDPAAKGLIVFKNDAGTRLGGDDDAVTSKRPIFTATGPSFEAMPPQALAVGDVTGDGRADAVVMLHWWASQNPSDPNDTRMHPLWQLLDSRGSAGLHAQSAYRLPAGPFVAAPVDFASDVLLRDLNNDRFPEIVVTSPFEPATTPGGIQALRLTPHLGTTSQLTSFEFDDVVVATGIANPHRLTAARYRGNKHFDLVLANNDGTTPLAWISNQSGGPTAPVSIIGAASTDNDPNGSDGPNGSTVYTVYPNGLIEYSLTIINNTASPLTNAVFDSLLPAVVTIEDAGGGTPVPSGTSTYVRWTETIPAETAITKHFTARVKPAAPVGSIIYPKNSLKYGTSTVYSHMPKVTLDEPISFELLSVNSGSDGTGAVVRFGEDINYRMRLTNRGKTAITNTLISMNMPAGTKFSGPLTSVPNTTQTLTAGNKRIDITVPSLAAESVQDLLVFVEATGADNTTISNNTMTAQRPSGSKRTLAAVKTTIKPAIDVEWYSVYSFSDPRNQSGGEPLNGTTVHYGESIRYRLKLINRSTIPQNNVKVGIAVPTGAHFDDGMSPMTGIAAIPRVGNKGIDFTITTFPGSTYQPNGTPISLSAITDVKMDVQARAADYAKIVQSSTTVQVPGRAIVKPGTYTIECKPALEITLRTDPANLANVKPGAVLTYQLQAKNWGSNAVSSGKVVNQIPEGTQILSAQADDGGGTTSPFRSGDFIGSDQTAVALTATSRPAFIREDRMLLWDLGQVDPGMMKTMRYKVRVATDLESAYFIKGQSVTLNMLNIEYNFVGTANTGKRIFAFVPLNATYAAPANADPFWFLPVFGKAPAITVAIDTTAPLPKPQLVLNKHAVGQRIIPEPAAPAEPYAKLPQTQENGDFIFTVENDSTKTNDAVFNYVLRYTNKGGAPATNVRVKDVLPKNTIFVGFLAKDNVLVSSYAFSRFYDAGGKLLDMNVASNTTKVRSFDLYAGDLAIGESHAFTYQVLVPDTVAVGTVITSTRGGVVGVTSGLNYQSEPGYQLGADELHFPVNGGPADVKVKITQVANFVLLLPKGLKSAPGIAAPSSGAAQGARYAAAREGGETMATDEPEAISLTMPYDVRGDAGAAPLPPLSNMKMTFTLPKGYTTDDAYVNSENNVRLKTLNASASLEGNGYVSAIRQANGTIKISFPLDGVPFAWPTAKIIYDPLHMSMLVDANGTKDPAYVDVRLTGNYNGTKVIPEVKSRVRIDSRAAPAKDAKIFVGRCAPISVKRGDSFTYTIFVGTLTDLPMNQGIIRMTVPAGCTGISATAYRWNGTLTGFGDEISSFKLSSTILPKGTPNSANDGYTWTTPLISGTLVSWFLGSMTPSEGGAVTFTVKVGENFVGDRIDDESCNFEVINAMQKSAGPLSVVVRSGNEDGQLAEITQRWLQGGAIKHNDGVTTELKKGFQLVDNSNGISIGGADVLQMSHGVNLIPMPNDRVMLVGPANRVFDAEGGVTLLRTVANSARIRIIVGSGVSGAASLNDVPGYSAGVVAANQVLTDLGVPGLNILAKRHANVLIGNGGNLVRSGSSTFAGAGISGADAPALLLPNNAALLISSMTDAKLIGQDGAGIVAGGGGNAVTGSGGWIIAPGPAGVVANDGAGVVANDGAGLIGHDGATLIGHDGATLIGHDGATLVGLDGASVVANDGAGLIGQDGAGIVAGGGLNATQVHNGNR